ncbi:hypothetical protein RZS08_29440, partial [Arthrospira platensis SPKY1]|nr:hypothetical protein [Arthrospira platensis SPKY1]
NRVPPGARYIDVPGFDQGELRTFAVGSGAELGADDLIICERIERLGEIEPGAFHVVVCRTRGVMIRRVERYENSLLLRVRLQQEPIPLSEVRELWRAIACVTTRFPLPLADQGDQGDRGCMIDRLERIESILS